MLGIFLDTETNGLNMQRHRILEVAFKILDIVTGEEKDSFQSVVYQPYEEWKKSDPLSLEINGFSWEEIEKGKPPQKIGEEIQLIFKKNRIQRGQSVFVCQNPSFDRSFFNQLVDGDIQEKLNWPYHWLDLASMFWTYCLLNKHPLPLNNGLSKNKIAEYFHLPPEGNPHKAMHGVDHLILCYQAVIGC